MSKAQKGRTIKWGAKISIAKKSWYASEQGQKFIKKLRQRIGSKNPMFNKSEEISRRHWTRLSNQDKREQIVTKFREFRMKQRFPLKSTKIEKMMEDELKRRNIAFLTHQPVLNICQPDILISESKLAIQCDGDWWHANPKFCNYNTLSKIQKHNIERDIRQDSLLKREDWHVMRFWESEIKEDVFACVDKIENFLKQEGL